MKKAVREIQASVKQYDSSLETNQFLIERMVVCPRGEFIAGVTHKLGIGHALVIGHGGTSVEELKDFTTLLLPASVVQIEKSLQSLRIMQSLQLHKVDIEVLTQTIYNIAQFAYHARDRLLELDVNPIILDIEGSVNAVDAYMRITE